MTNLQIDSINLCKKLTIEEYFADNYKNWCFDIELDCVINMV